jgi:PBP1b-binding outer membrane lipoprotein LpoB
MNKTQTILIMLLAFLLLFTACGKASAEFTTASPDATSDPAVQTSGVSSDTTASTEVTEPAETGPAAPEIEAIDGQQSEFRILGRKSGSDEYYLPFAEFKVDTQIGDVMNDAVYERNLFL